MCLPTNLTAAGQVIGTPQYMAPEQVEHPQQVDHRADIYSLGVVFYQMLTGELPIGRFAPPSKKVQIDVRLDEVVLRALEKEPDRRYQQASEMKTRVRRSSPRRQTVRHTRGPNPVACRCPVTELDDALRRARRQVNGPAIGLLVTGILNWVATPLIVLVLFYIGSGRFVHIVPAVGLVPALVLNLVFSTLIILGALKMERLEWHDFAIGASVSAIIVTPGNLIGLPIGIWALVVLSQREVRAAFGRRRGSDDVGGAKRSSERAKESAADIGALHGPYERTATPLRSGRGYFTTPEYLRTTFAGFWPIQGSGELALYKDRLRFVSGWQQTEIPFASLRELGMARLPRWMNPPGFKYLSLIYDDKGQRKTLSLSTRHGLVSHRRRYRTTCGRVHRRDPRSR